MRTAYWVKKSSTSAGSEGQSATTVNCLSETSAARSVLVIKRTLNGKLQNIVKCIFTEL